MENVIVVYTTFLCLDHGSSLAAYAALVALVLPTSKSYKHQQTFISTHQKLMSTTTTNYKLTDFIFTFLTLMQILDNLYVITYKLLSCSSTGRAWR